MALIIMYTALFEAGWLLYENAKGPTTIEKEEGSAGRCEDDKTR